MPDISITVREKIAQTQGAPEIVCGNSDYTAVFDLDEEWDDYDLKTAHFIWLDARSGKLQEYETVFSGTSVAIPAIYRTDLLLIGIYAGNIRTTSSARIPCIRCITDDGEGHPAPSPDIYEQLLEAIGQIDPPAPPSPQRAVTAALDVPYYTGITQDASPRGVAIASAEYETMFPSAKAFFYYDQSYSPPRAFMITSQADRFDFADTLQESTDFVVKRSNSNYGIIYPYDKSEASTVTNNEPRVQLFKDESGVGHVMPIILYDSGGYQTQNINHQKGDMIYSSTAGYNTDGPKLFYEQNADKTLLLIGIGSGTDYHMDILFDKLNHIIAYIPDGGGVIKILVGRSLFTHTLGASVVDSDIISLARLTIPEIGILLPDVFIAPVFGTNGFSRQFTFGDDTYVSSGNVVSDEENFVIKL